MITSLILKVFRLRWLASIILVLLLDVITYLAFSKSGDQPLIENQDKVLHAAAFFILFILVHISLNFDFFPNTQKFSYRIFLLNWTIWISYGLFIEMVQKYLSYRSSSLADFIADLIGMSLGSLLIVLLKLYPRSPEKP